MAWLSNYAKRRKITVQQAYLDSDLTNFPLYVKLADDANVKDALSTGYDVRFTQSDGETLLKYERESWSGGGGSNVTADFWTKVPSLASTGDATEIYLYWGKAGDSDGQDKTNVWDANFKGVWHLKESGQGSAGDFKDSTANEAHSTNSANQPDRATGKIGFGQDFNTSGDRIVTPYTIGATHTVEIILKADSLATYKSPIIDADGSYYCGLLTTGTGLAVWCEADGAKPGANNAVSTGAFYHVAVVRTGNSAANGLKVFVNGVVGSQNNTGTWVALTQPLWIGNQQNVTTRDWDGILDEARVSDVARSAAWLKFTYRNIFEADNEVTWGDVEEAGGGNTYEESLSLNLTAGFSAASAAILESSLAMSVNADVANSSIATLQSALSFSAAANCLIASDLTAAAALSLAITAAYQADSDLSAESALDIAATVGVSAASDLQAESAIAFSVSNSLAVAAANIVNESLALGVTADLTSAGRLIAESRIAAGITARISILSELFAESAIVLGVEPSLAVRAGQDFQESLTLAIAVQLLANPATPRNIIRMVLERMSRPGFANETMTVPRLTGEVLRHSKLTGELLSRP